MKLSAHLEEIVRWYSSFDGTTYEQARSRLPQEALDECFGDVDAAIGYELGWTVSGVVDDDQIEAVINWIIRNVPCCLCD